MVPLPEAPGWVICAVMPAGSPGAATVAEEDAPVTVTETEAGVPSCGARTIDDERVTAREPPPGLPPVELQATSKRARSGSRHNGGKRRRNNTMESPHSAGASLEKNMVAP